MRALPALLLVACLSGQEAKPVERAPVAPPPPRLKLPHHAQTPQELLRAMVAQDVARRTQPGATVEVIGYDDEAALKLLSVKVAQQVRLTFKATDKLQHRELYAFMQQDPSHPRPVMFIP